MSAPQGIHPCLGFQSTPYEGLPRPKAFTGQVVAHSLHVSGKRLANPVGVKADGCKAVRSILVRSLQTKRVMECTYWP